MASVAVIGVGSIGFHHARVYSELAEARLLAVADHNPSHVAAAASRLSVPAYTDYRELLNAERPEAVSVAVPIAHHEEVAIAALEAGAHVLVEKPIAATLESGERMIDCARRQGRQLMVGHILRFNPVIQELKRRLDAGELGRVFHITCRRVGPFPWRVRDAGVAVDLATHDLDLMRFLTNLDPLRVFAETERRMTVDRDDSLLGVLRFPEGVAGLLEINRLTPQTVREVCVLGERGQLRADTLTQRLFFHENAKEPTSVSFSGEEPLKIELRAFLRAVEGHSKVSVTGEDGLIALHLALSLLASSQEHHVKEIDLTEQLFHRRP